MLNIEIEENPDEENEGTEVDVENSDNNTSMYSKKYRVVKTLLLLFQKNDNDRCWPTSL